MNVFTKYISALLVASSCILSTSSLSAVFVGYSTPKIVTDSAGNKIAVFLRQDATGHFATMGSTWNATNGWSTPVALSTPTRSAYNPVIVINSLGHVVATWEAFDSVAVTDFVEAITYSSTFTNGWGSVMTLSDGSGDPAFADQRVVIDDVDGMTTIWTAFDSTGAQSVLASTASFAESPQWTAEVFVAHGSGI